MSMLTYRIHPSGADGCEPGRVRRRESGAEGLPQGESGQRTSSYQPLHTHLQKLDKKVPAALQTEGDLKELVDNVRSFQALIDETLRKADVKCVSDINEAKKQLQELDKQLQSSVLHSR